MTAQGVSWMQSFNHFSKALSQLTRFIQKGHLNELEKLGLLHSFENSYELAWNTLKDYFEAQGETNIHGSRDVFRLAFRRGIIEDGETWMDMIKSRTLTTHTYDEEIAEKIAADIANRYYSEFMMLATKMESLREEAS